MAEIEVDLNLLRQSIDIQLQKHREQSDDANYYEEDVMETIDEVSDDTSEKLRKTFLWYARLFRRYLKL
jgi:hypothetical protein